MSVNFFIAACQEQPLNNSLFGLCNDKNGQKAYTNTNNSARWIATVKNDGGKQLIFTAIDKCIIKDYEHQGRGRCDGMLTSDEHIYFVELKNQDKSWRTDAIEQLESTIKFFISSYNINVYRHKKAFACNKQHKHFQEIDNELNLHFFRKYGVRIDVQAEIIIV
ncbi:MAG: hypothetical protein HY738_18365 [Bacteroidia bacterium]|nr:hypothetical protein [Bacteroidia bacterium]